MNKTYAQIVFENFKSNKIAFLSLIVVLIFCLVGVYAPLLASSKPLVVNYNGVWYFPLFRYLFFSGFYTKSLDLFFNVLMFTLPCMALSFFALKKSSKQCWTVISSLILLTLFLFMTLLVFKVKDPSESSSLNALRQEALKSSDRAPSFAFDLKYMNDYKKLNLLLNYEHLKRQNERILPISHAFELKAKEKQMEMKLRDKKASLLREGVSLQNFPSDESLRAVISKEMDEKIVIPTLWNINEENKREEILRLKEEIAENPDDAFAKASLQYIYDKENWLQEQTKHLSGEVMPLIRDFHFEEDAGGEQSLNQYLPWYELSRINRKDLVSALIFGVRVSLVVGVLAVGLSLLISIPVGAYAGYYGGTFDIIVSRLLEVLEAMPVFFMLLMIIAITMSKSIFLVILMIGLFGWTGFSRYIRGEFFKQRNLSYVQSGRALGFTNTYIMFSHILPNAIPPLLTLLPFAVMGAITSEAGLSFLGLGEEGSTSWGVLMNEGRTAFPAESYLLWPPAILLTILLVAIALVGDGLRDAIDPKMS